MKINGIGNSLFTTMVFLTATITLHAESPSAAQVKAKRVFSSPLEWSGAQEPPEKESAALLQAINTLEKDGLKPGFAAFEDFLKRDPQSAWAPSLNVNVADYYRREGRYTLALPHWEAAWDATKESTDPAAQRIAVRSVAGWTRLLASLGEKEKLTALFKQLDERKLPLGSFATIIDETRGGLAMMNARPGDSYRCGSYALGYLAEALHSDAHFQNEFFEAESPDGGFHLSQLLKLAETNGVALAAVRRPPGSEIIVPSVVHWKLHHYAAIVEKKENRYRVIDPTFEGHVWMDAETIDAEMSGAFLVPKDRVPVQWAKLSDAECALIYGKGGPNDINNNHDNPNCNTGSSNDSDEAASSDQPSASDCDTCPSCQDNGPGGGGNGGAGGGGAGGTGGRRMGTTDHIAAGDNVGGHANIVAGDNMGTGGKCSSCGGMPVWGVSEPYETLWLTDIPLFYRLSSGNWMTLTVKYKHRGIDKGSLVGSFGPKWECDWLDMLQSHSGSDTYTNFVPGGGLLPFNTNGDLEYQTAKKLVINGGVPSLVSPKGGRTIYGTASGDLTGTTNYFLTQWIDRYGRTEVFTNETVGSMVRLKSVTDLDGQTCTLTYGNATFTNLITAVTDPYGRSASFTYDNQGRLTNIVDMAGMSSSFQYDNNNNITNLTTPYGATAFQYLSGTSSIYSSTVRRAILVTEATGDKQLYEYCDLGPDSWRNSYHWNRAQYAAISSTGKGSPLDMPDADYLIGEVRNWLHATVDPLTVSDTLNTYAPAADPDGTRHYTSYGYVGQGGALGTLKRTSLITYLPGSSNASFDRNSVGRATTYSLTHTDGKVEIYYYTYNSGGQRILNVVGPRSELVRGYTYGAAITNLLTAETNAIGEVTQYLYDTNIVKLTSISYASGLLRSNIYYSSGANTGFLLKQLDVGFRTNSFGYLNGNLAAETNELGLVKTYLYDNLNRLISAAFPDGTTISNIYDKLDLVATKDRTGQWSYFGFNAVRQLMAETNVNGQITQYTYCGCGGPSQIARWLSGSTLNTYLNYDMLGRLTNAIYPDSYQLNYTYDSAGRIDTITDSGNHQWERTYVRMGLVDKIATETLGGYVLLGQQYDEYGRLTASTNRNLVVTTNNYDFLNRSVARGSFGDSDATGVETFIYDATGLTNFTDALGHSTAYVRDATGQVLSELNANNEFLQFTYDAAGNLSTLLDGKTNTTSWHYDEYSRATNKVDAAGNVDFIYKYDPDNRLTNRWTPYKGNTVYKYDPIGNLTNIVYDHSGTVKFQYDDLNRLTNMVDNVGTTKFAWTDGNQLASEDGPWSSDTVSYTYADRLRTALSLQQPSLTWTQGYQYSGALLLTNVTSKSGKFVYGYESSISDKVNALALPSGMKIQNYHDTLMRLTNTFLVNSTNATLNAHQYAYNQGNQRTNETRTDSSTVKYAYDHIGQLTNADSSVGGEDRTYTYDKAGNLSVRNGSDTFTVDNLNELVSEPAGDDWYDSNGNLQWQVYGADPWWWNSSFWLYQYEYDDENRLTFLTYYDLAQTPVAGTGFSYDGFSRLRERIEYSYDAETEIWTTLSTTRYIYDGKRVIQERDDSNNPLVSYTRGNDMSGTLEGAGGIGGLLARSGSYASGNWTNNAFYHADGNGNITCMVNTNQSVVASYRYDPFGNTISSSGSLAAANVYRFSSKEIHVNSGLYYYLYRFYDPNLQRWINRDPLGEESDISLYSFVQNTPINSVDSLGLEESPGTGGKMTPTGIDGPTTFPPLPPMGPPVYPTSYPSLPTRPIRPPLLKRMFPSKPSNSPTSCSLSPWLGNEPWGSYGKPIHGIKITITPTGW